LPISQGFCQSTKLTLKLQGLAPAKGVYPSRYLLTGGQRKNGLASVFANRRFFRARRAHIKRAPLAGWEQNNWVGASFFGNALRALRSRVQSSELGRRLFRGRLRGRYRLFRGRCRLGRSSCRGAVFVINHFFHKQKFSFFRQKWALLAQKFQFSSFTRQRQDAPFAQNPAFASCSFIVNEFSAICQDNVQVHMI